MTLVSGCCQACSLLVQILKARRYLPNDRAGAVWESPQVRVTFLHPQLHYKTIAVNNNMLSTKLPLGNLGFRSTSTCNRGIATTTGFDIHGNFGN